MVAGYKIEALGTSCHCDEVVDYDVGLPRDEGRIHDGVVVDDMGAEIDAMHTVANDFLVPFLYDLLSL